MSDTEIVNLMKKSDGAGYAALVNKYGSYVYAVVMNRIRSVASEAEADECVTDILTEIFSRASQIDLSRGTLKTFAGTVASSRATDTYRRLQKARSRRITPEEFESLCDDSSPELETEERHESIRLWKAVTELGIPDSDILIMQYFYRFSLKEIADRLSLSVAAAKQRSRRARQKLRKILEEGDSI